MGSASTIGVVAPVLNGFYYDGLLRGIQAAAVRHGLHLLAVQSTLRDLVETRLAADRVAGWIVLLDVDGLGELLGSGAPAVTVSALVPELSCPAVLPNNKDGMRAAVEHLIEHGHRRIAFVGNLAQEDIQQRYAGYVSALVEANIPFDPELIIRADDNLEHGGQVAAQRLLATAERRRPARLPCTAIVAATDLNALGMMPVLAGAGYRIPDDLAIVGFDDMSAAQYATPPLTTVRQRLDALGETAAELLLAQLAGQPAATQYVATALVQRRSCGCNGPQIAQGALLAAAEGGLSWQQHLARQLLRLVLYPVLPDPGQPPEQTWPGCVVLIAALERALGGEPPIAAAALEHAWHEARTLTDNLAALHAVNQQLEVLGRQHIGAADDAAAARLAQFMERSRLELSRALLGYEKARITTLEGVVDTNNDIRLLLDRPEPPPRTLRWLERTLVRWGCLALWEHPATLRIAGVYRHEGAQIGQACTAAEFPPAALLPPPAEHGPQAITVLPLGLSLADRGVLLLGETADPQRYQGREHMQMWATMLCSALEREMLMASIAEQQATLRAAFEQQRALGDTIRQLGCPLIPLLPDVLLVPLIGAIDSERAAAVVETLLSGITAHQATTVLLDVTGIAAIDVEVAQMLMQLTGAAKLLGARLILVGVRPVLAERIVALGLDLRAVTTQPTLAEAIAALQR